MAGCQLATEFKVIGNLGRKLQTQSQPFGIMVYKVGAARKSTSQNCFVHL